MGTTNTDMLTVISGPTRVTLNRGGVPGREWWVLLGTARFKVSIEDTTGATLADFTARIQQVSARYRRAFEIVSEPGKNGIAWYRDIGGAAAHGGQEYLNVVTSARASVLAHECGHIIEQRARNFESDILDRWLIAKHADAVSVSQYGNGAHWEDQAEFARIYAYCHDAGHITDLRRDSPRRFALWERMLSLAEAVQPTDLCETACASTPRGRRPSRRVVTTTAAHTAVPSTFGQTTPPTSTFSPRVPRASAELTSKHSPTELFSHHFWIFRDDAATLGLCAELECLQQTGARVWLSRPDGSELSGPYAIGHSNPTDGAAPGASPRPTYFVSSTTPMGGASGYQYRVGDRAYFEDPGSPLRR